jgi:uroporphyrinogen decarboxylase
MALNHQEPDRVPFDLGSTQVTGIHVGAYRSLREALGLAVVDPHLCDVIQQLATPGADLIRCLGVDVRGLFPLNSHNWNVVEEEAGEYWLYRDEWGIVHRRPRPDGLYYSLYQSPLTRPELTVQDIESHPWPDFSDPVRITGLKSQAQTYRSQGFGVVLKDPFAGVFEMAQRIVGMENCLTIMAVDKKLAGVLFEKITDLKIAFWEMALPQLADSVDVITQADDFGTQVSQLISPRMFRDQLKPHWSRVLNRLQALAPEAKRFFHSCGSVRPLIPDFIEMGVQILNPVHTRAIGMEPAALKRDFGDALVFWGGGVDTQGVLPHGSPEAVKADVRRSLETLMPGGGYVFNTIHNIQADVPVANLLAMYEALSEYGSYC